MKANEINNFSNGTARISTTHIMWLDCAPYIDGWCMLIHYYMYEYLLLALQTMIANHQTDILTVNKHGKLKSLGAAQTNWYGPYDVFACACALCVVLR